MDYRVASNIRGKSLSSLITDKITSGGSIGSSIRSSISDKLKAKGTGIKEKFDPMNIARAMTGGSRLAPAILGRLTGRSQADINYFAGDKRKGGSYTQIPTAMSTPGEGLGGSAVEVLNRMLSFMQKSREDDLEKKETAKAFQEEQRVEDQRRHKEFLDVLKEYTSLSGGTTTLVKKEEGDGLLSGLMNTIKSMINSAIEGVKTMFNTALAALEWVKDLKILTKLLPYAARLLTFLASPLGVALLGTAAILYLADQLKVYFRENVANMNALSPEKAVELLQTPGAYREIEKYGGREAVMKIAKEGHLEAKRILDTQDPKKINDAGGKEFLEQVVARGAVTVPESAAEEDLSQFEKELKLKRPKGSGLAVKNQQADWDAKYGKIYDPETGKRLDLLGKPTAIQADVRKIDNAAEATPMTPQKMGRLGQFNRMAGASTTGAKLIPQTTVSSRMDNAFEEYQALNMVPPGNTQTTPAVLTTNTSTVDLPDRPIPATATVRDKTPILDYVLEQYASPI